MKSFIFATIMLVFLSLTLLPGQSMGQEATDVKTLFEKKCSACHSADRAKSLKKTNEEWTKTVMRMKEKRNENITNDEAKIIIDYLTKTYGK
jgi:nitrate/TMAO reductase-like tetraheme cytochrome c subunit